MGTDARARRWLAFGLAVLTTLSGVACDYGDGDGAEGGEQEQQQQQEEEDGGDTGY